MADSRNPHLVFFGKELKRRREQAGLTGKQLADKLGCTPQWISTMESGRKASEPSATDIDTFFETDGFFQRLWQQASEFEITVALPPGFQEYLEHEKGAVSVRVFNALLLSGLFQGEDYARVVLGFDGTPNLDGRLASRLARQEIYTRDSPANIWLTVDEDVLHRPIGGPEVQRKQLAFLLEASDRPNVMLNVIPQRVGYHPGLAGSFILLDHADGTSVAYTESAGIGVLISEPSQVVLFGVRYDSLRGYALPVDESRALVNTVLESL
jgi:transcriptional regulator with XRE-family HTH domain